MLANDRCLEALLKFTHIRCSRCSGSWVLSLQKKLLLHWVLRFSATSDPPPGDAGCKAVKCFAIGAGFGMESWLAQRRDPESLRTQRQRLLYVIMLPCHPSFPSQSSSQYVIGVKYSLYPKMKRSRTRRIIQIPVSSDFSLSLVISGGRV